MCDDDFEPNLGKINSQGGKHGGKYLHRVLRATVLAGSRSLGGLSSRRGTFEGSRIGRSAGIGRVLASRDRYAAYRSRRAIVKSRIVKLAGNRAKAALAHLRYIQRDGDTRDGEPGQLTEPSGIGQMVGRFSHALVATGTNSASSSPSRMAMSMRIYGPLSSGRTRPAARGLQTGGRSGHKPTAGRWWSSSWPARAQWCRRHAGAPPPEHGLGQT